MAVEVVPAVAGSLPEDGRTSASLIYDAFISYSHAKDKVLASALQSAMQRLGKPWYQRRALRLFRDDTSLTATPHLWPDIEKALICSRFLILLASPEAAASPWVDREVSAWLAGNSPDTVLIALTDGELRWDATQGDFRWNQATPLPPSLRRRFAEEPRWIDLRSYRDGVRSREPRFADLAADFAAVLHGRPKDDLLSQEVRQQRRALRLAGTAVALLGVLLATAGWEWCVATFRAAETQLERNNGLAELAAAEQLKGNFDGSLRLAVHAARLNLAPGWFAHPGPLPSAELASAMMRTRWRLLLSGHEDSVRYAAYSGDGSRIVTASDDGTARVWDAATGVQIALFRGDDAATSANFSPDGSQLVIASANSAYIWTISSAAPAMTLHEDGGTVLSAVFSPDGRHVVTASSDGTAQIWDANTGQVAAVLKGHDAAVNSAAYNSDGTRIITASSDGTARLWDAALGTQLALVHAGQIPIFAASLSPDGHYVLVISGENVAHIWDALTGAEVATLRGHEGQLSSGIFNPDGSLVVTTSSDKTARIWNWSKAKTIAVLRGHGSGLSAAAFSPDGSKIVTASWDHTARIWDTGSGSTMFPLGDRVGALNGAAFDPEGSRILTLAEAGTLQLWPAASADSAKTLQSDARFAAFSSDGSRIIATSVTGVMRIWDSESGMRLAASPPDLFVEHAALSSDNTRVVTVSGRDAIVWDAMMTHRVAMMRETSVLMTAVFSPDGSRVVTTALNSLPRMWDAGSGIEVGGMQGHNELKFHTNTAAFSPDGSRIVTTSQDKTARIWDAESRKELTEIDGHDGEVRSAVFNADNSRLMTTSVDGTVRMWDASTGKEIAALDIGSPVKFAALSHDGGRVLAAGADGVPQIWDVRYATMPAMELVVEACSRRLLGKTILTAGEMRIAGYPDGAEPRDVCSPWADPPNY